MLKAADVYSGSAVGLETTPEAQIAIIKATQGTGYVNPRCNTQYANAKKAGRLLGLYHYAQTADPVAEADYFIRNVKNYVGEAVLVLDWESYQNKAFGSTTWARRFVDEVHKLTGVWPLIYVSISDLKQVASCAKDCGLWVAGYPTNNHSWAVPDWAGYCKRFGYSIAPWTAYTLWQYTGGDIDRSVAGVDAAGWKTIAKGTKATKSATEPKKKEDDIVRALEPVTKKGVATVLTTADVYADAGLTGKPVKTIKAGRYAIHDVKDGAVNLGGDQWVSGLDVNTVLNPLAYGKRGTVTVVEEVYKQAKPLPKQPTSAKEPLAKGTRWHAFGLSGAFVDVGGGAWVQADHVRVML